MATETTSPAPRPMRKGTGRRLAATGIVLAAAILSAWLSAPWWVPTVVQWLLPPDWRIEQLDLRRPGFTETRVDRLRLTAELPAAVMIVDARDARIEHFGAALTVESVDLTISPAEISSTGESTEPWRGRFAVPPVPAGGDWPEITVRRVTLTTGEPEGAKTYELEDLHLERTPDGAKLGAALSPVPLLTVNGRLTVKQQADGALDAVLSVEAAPRDPLFRYRQQAGASAATARLALDLGLLDLEALSPWSTAAGLGALRNAEGTLRLAVELEGADRLQPDSGRIEAESLAIVGDELSLQASGAVGIVGLADDRLRLETDEFQLALELARRDWLAAAEQRLAAVGLEGLVSETPARLGLLATGRSSLALDRAAGAFELGGDASLVWDQEGAATLEIATAGLHVWRDGEAKLGLAADELSASFQHAGSIRARVDGVPLTVEGPSLRVLGKATLDPGVFPGLELAVDTATTRRLEAELAGYHVLVDELVLGGQFRSDRGVIEFDGPVAGRRLRIGEGPEAAASLLAASSFRAPLLLRDFNRLESRGPVELSGVRLAQDSLRMGRLDLSLGDWTLGTGDGAFNAVTTGLERVVDGKPLGGLDVDLEGTLEAWSRAAGTGEALAGLAAALPFGWRADLDRGVIELRFDNAELEATGLRSALRPLEVALPEPLKFRSGSVFLDGEVTLSLAEDGSAPQGAIDLRAEDLAFSYGESRVDGLGFRTRVELADAFRSSGRLSAETVALAAGLDLTGLDTGLRTSGENEFGLQGLSAELLGGRVEVVELSVVDRMPQAATVEWLGFDLGLLLAFLDVGGLDGTGTIDARFPIASEGGALIIEDGEFAARGPGRIRYTSGAPAANIGLQALENFEYDSLDGKINYAADGAYTIALRLLGRNPDLYGGHPVRFRLNLGGELPALFRSLFVTGDFDRAIIERLRSRAGEIDE